MSADELEAKFRSIESEPPALFSRMLTDPQWFYKITTVSNRVYYACEIGAVRPFAGQYWIDFEEDTSSLHLSTAENRFKAPTSRKQITLNIAQIQSIVESMET